MSIQKLDTWAAKFVQTYPLSILKDAVLGVDASYYLDLRLNENKEEPLKSALGGVPFALKSGVEDDIQAAREAGVTLIFIFNGLDHVNKPVSNAYSASSIRAHEDGWRHYLGGDAASPVNDFGKAKYPLEVIYRHLRKILQKNHVDYLVAPYSATAQLAYLYRAQHVDGVMSSTDAFLFNMDKVVLNIDARTTSFDWLNKSTCEERLGRIGPDVLRDAQLLLGSPFLPPFPILERASSKPGITDALSLLNGAGRSVVQLCHQYRDDIAVQNLNYAERYKKAVLAIRHHIVLETDGVVAPLDFDHAPGDIHDYVGQRLPEELFFYISRGLLGSQIPTWLTSGEIDLRLPGGVLDSNPYGRLVIDQLNPMRTQALKIVAESLNYYYSSREVNLRTWDNRDTSALKIELKVVQPLKARASEWRVKHSNLASTKLGHGPTLLSCLSSLKDKAYAQKTIIKGRVEHPALKTQEEILSNVFWRFLQIRGYIDDKHELTNHGIMLEAALSSLAENGVKEELAVIAIELLRFGLLNTGSITGVQVQPQDKDYKHKSYTNLVSKIACLGRLKHEPMGYVGPLDRQLLSFAWMITAVRTSLRDLIEATMTGMFLNGDVSREREDWNELPQKLPFISDNGSALGVATKTYLDALRDKDLNGELKDKIKNQEDKYSWFAQVRGGTLTTNLETAFKLFDAVNAATHVGGKDLREAKAFAEAEEWLAPRR